MPVANLAQPPQQIILLFRAALDFDDQHRLRIQRIAGMREILAGVDRRTVHELQRHRNDARRK